MQNGRIICRYCNQSLGSKAKNQVHKRVGQASKPSLSPAGAMTSTSKW